MTNEKELTAAELEQVAGGISITQANPGQVDQNGQLGGKPRFRPSGAVTTIA